MKGDFSRNSFDASRHFTRVLMQQGRVQLDADWNEQTSILLHYLQVLAADLIGPHGGPADNWGFEISVDETASTEPGSPEPVGGEPIETAKSLPKLDAGDFHIGIGHYYVDGILCENEEPTTYAKQSYYPITDNEKLKASAIKQLVYLDVWERHITYVEDDSIREIALGGPDTATRARLMQQVKVLPLTEPEQKVLGDLVTKLKLLKDKNRIREVEGVITTQVKNILEKHNVSASNARLRARALVNETADKPCIISPDSNYRGAENQLYRVEIHRGGDLSKHDAVTFKWSRDNGSIVFPIRRLATGEAVLTHLGQDSQRSLQIGDWVEIVDDDNVLLGQPRPLRQIENIKRTEMKVTFEPLKNAGPNDTPAFEENSNKHPMLRRWDHRERASENKFKGGAVALEENDGEGNDKWITLEDGVQIQFPKAAAGTPHQYNAGDYWLIPARTVTGDVLWPKDQSDKAIDLPPHGVEHHYAPLALITFEAGKQVVLAADLRRRFDTI